MWLQAWDSGPTPGLRPLPHSLLKLRVPCPDFLLSAQALPFGPASRLVPLGFTSCLRRRPCYEQAIASLADPQALWEM